MVLSQRHEGSVDFLMDNLMIDVGLDYTDT